MKASMPPHAEGGLDIHIREPQEEAGRLLLSKRQRRGLTTQVGSSGRMTLPAR